MIETDPNAVPYTKPFELAEMIEWGYETSGDFDEALRVYIEMTQHDGFALLYYPSDLDMARTAFDTEFGKDRHERD